MVTDPINCVNPGCIGWSLLLEDQFCSWCGTLLAELEFRFEIENEGRWSPLAPALLVRDHRPRLRLRLSHVGRSGRVRVAPDRFQVSASWLGLAIDDVQERYLGPGEEITIAVNRLKVPGNEDSFQRFQVHYQDGPVAKECEILFVPRPDFGLELAGETVLLLPEEPARIEATLRLNQGQVILQKPPQFKGRWVRLIWDEGVRFPLELDARGRSSVGLTLEVEDDTLDQLRQSAVHSVRERLRRGGVLRVGEFLPVLPDCEDVQLPVEVHFLLGPEFVLDPFFQESRLDRVLLQGAEEWDGLELRLGNGLAGSQGRINLVVRSLDLDQPWASCEGAEFPMTIPSGESESFFLRIHRDRLEPGQHVVRLAFSTNDPNAREVFICLTMAVPEPFPGWLVVDLGTSTTCAALVDHHQKLHLLDLEEDSVDGDNTTLPSAVSYLTLEQGRDFEVGSWALQKASHPSTTRSVIKAAKRFLGARKHHFEVVPVDQPGVTGQLTATDVVGDIFSKLRSLAQSHLVARQRHDVQVQRLLLCHPSRFSLRQLGAFQEAAHRAWPELEITTIQEPLGAALDDLQSWVCQAPLHERKDSDQVDYHLLVYDFGGGTLDITLLKVSSEREPLQAGQHRSTRSQLRQLFLETMGLSRLQEEQAFLLDSFIESVLEAVRTGVPLNELSTNPLVDEGLTLDVDDEFRTWERRQLLTSRAIAILEKSHPYFYVVEPTVLGATGDRWLGGEDVTTALEQDLKARIREVASDMLPHTDSVEFPLSFEGARSPKELCGQRNRFLLRDWAERLKVALSDGEPDRVPFPGLFFWVDDEEEFLPPTTLEEHLVLPTLEELEDSVYERLTRSLERIDKLLNLHQLDAPEVVLRVGKASKLPLVERLLRRRFPTAIHRHPDRYKRCVVEGASGHPVPGAAGGGIQLARGRRRPGVRIRWPRPGALNSTTSRLGVKIVDSGEAFFHPLIEAGVPLGTEGLRAELEGLVLSPGLNHLTILENADHRDELLLADGSPNPDVEELEVLSFNLPEGHSPRELEAAGLLFLLSPELVLTVEIWFDNQPVHKTVIESERLGGSY